MLARDVLTDEAEEPLSQPIRTVCPYCCVPVDDLRAHLRASFPNDTDEMIEAMVARAVGAGVVDVLEPHEIEGFNSLKDGKPC